MVLSPLTSSLKIAASVSIVLVVGVLLSSQPVEGTTFASKDKTGRLELTVDSTAYYNGVLQPALTWEAKNLVPTADHFFTFSDVKPGDSGSTTISLHLKRGSAWACLDFRRLLDDENYVTEPEVGEDTVEGGDLSRLLQFFAWRDDGDGVYEIGEEALFGGSQQSAKDVLKDETYALADSTNRPAYRENSTNYVGVEWCAGTLTVDQSIATVSCDGRHFGNESQTDSLSVDVVLRAVNARSSEKFTCVRPVKPPCSAGGPRVKGKNSEKDCNHDDWSPHKNQAEGKTDDDSDFETERPEWQIVKRPYWHSWLAWTKLPTKEL